jgi:AmiR/NasT family two-component response regulator
VWEVQAVSTEFSDALNGWIVTEQAKGIVAERQGLDIAAAYAKMQQFARDHNLNVVDIALGVVDGTLDVS